MNPGHTFARRVFLWAGIYGIVALVPQYFLAEKLGRMVELPLAYPEQLYGFIGTALAWQFAFVLIARDVVRYRLFMLPGIAEKLLFSVPVFVLFAMGRVPPTTVAAAALDFALGLLFIAAYRRTRPAPV